MKNIYSIPKVLVIIMLSNVFSSCGFFTKSSHGELTRRFRTYTETPNQTITNHVNVDAYAFSPETPAPSKPKGFYDLAPDIQKYLVWAYAWKDNSSADLIKSIASPFSIPKKAEDVYIDDRTSFKKRLVFSIRNRSYNPADRIWKINITLTKPDGNIRFSSSSTLVTDFERVDVGKLAYNRKNVFNTNLNAGSGVSVSSTEKNIDGSESTSETTSGDEKSGQTDQTVSKSGSETGSNRTAENKVGGTIGFNSEFSSNEEVLLKQRFVKLSGFVKKNSLSLYQESTSGIDLSGNVIADVEFSYTVTPANQLVNQTVFEFNNLLTGATYNNPNQITVKEFVVLYPNVAADIYGCITFDAVVRQVVKKSKTIAESDDEVKFIGGFTTCTAPPGDVLLLARREVTPMFWHILNAAGNPIRIKSPAMANPIDLLFRSFDDAKNFIVWLKQKANQTVTAGGVVGNNFQLLAGVGGTLNVAGITAFSVHRVIN